ncbi:MAG: phosphate transport system permease protein [Nocardioidaceae bacterium]|nr:phosphate transport system permease protein [Nocardioidaceae bacterium]
MTNRLTKGRGPDDLAIQALEEQLRSPRLHRLVTPGIGLGAVLVALVLYLGLGNGLALSIIFGWLVFAVVLYVASRLVEGSRKSTDRLATIMVSTAFVVALLPLASLLWEVFSNGVPVISSTFLTASMRNVLGSGGGVYHAIWGTILVTGMAAVLSVPVGLLTAIYLVEYGDGTMAKAITFLVDVMTGIPSIVAGLFAYALFAIFFGAGVRMGFAGSVALSVLMIPLVVRSAEEMLKLVPRDLREASYALGVPKWRTITKVVLPTAVAGIVTGVTIAIARVIGETAPLLIICGFTDSTNFNVFNGRIMTLPVYIYEEFKNPGFPPQFSTDRAWGAALVLTVIIMVLSLAARTVSRLFAPKPKA